MINTLALAKVNGTLLQFGFDVRKQTTEYDVALQHSKDGVCHEHPSFKYRNGKAYTPCPECVAFNANGEKARLAFLHIICEGASETFSRSKAAFDQQLLLRRRADELSHQEGVDLSAQAFEAMTLALDGSREAVSIYEAALKCMIERQKLYDEEQSRQAAEDVGQTAACNTSFIESFQVLLNGCKHTLQENSDLCHEAEDAKQELADRSRRHRSVCCTISNCCCGVSNQGSIGL